MGRLGSRRVGGNLGRFGWGMGWMVGLRCGWFIYMLVVYVYIVSCIFV